MLDLGLDLQGTRDVYLFAVNFQVGDLSGGHKAEPGLDIGQGDPQPAPEQALVSFAPDLAHGWCTITPGKGRQVVIIIGHGFIPFIS